MIASVVAAGAGAALATPATFQLTLKPTGLGDQPPIFGISSVPADPFVGTFSLDSGLLTPNRPFGLVSVLNFDLTIGSKTFTDPFVSLIEIATDAAGAIDALQIFSDDGLAQLAVHFNDPAIPTKDGWSAWDHTNLPDSCGVSGIGGYIFGFDDRDTGLIAAERVPEPMTIALFGVGLAGLGVLRRRRAA